MASMLKCKKCEKWSPAGSTECTHCGASLASVGADSVESDGVSDPLESSTRSPVVRRYRDAYRVGAALVGLGNAIKVVGGILAGIIVLGSLASANSPFGGGAVVAGIFLAAIVGVLFWVSGVTVAAQGEILRATLDTAVASSQFLTDTERADAMGLPRSVAARSVPK